MPMQPGASAKQKTSVDKQSNDPSETKSNETPNAESTADKTMIDFAKVIKLYAFHSKNSYTIVHI